MTKPAYDPSREQLDFIAGDGAGRTHGSMGSGGGVATDTNMTKNAWATPMLRYTGRYGDFVIESELYRMPLAGGGFELMLHIMCPVCSTREKPHALRITSAMKKIEFDHARGVSVEKFGCAWELPDAAPVAGATNSNAQNQGNMVIKGRGLCPWRVAIENNRVYDAG